MGNWNILVKITIMESIHKAFHFNQIDSIEFTKKNRLDNIWLKYLDKNYLIVEFNIKGPEDKTYHWFFQYLEGVEEGIAKTWFNSDLKDIFRPFVAARMNVAPKRSCWWIEKINGKDYKWVMIHPDDNGLIVWPKLEIE